MTGLGSKKANGLLGLDGGPHYFPGVSVNSGGNVNGNDRFLRFIDGFDPGTQFSC